MSEPTKCSSCENSLDHVSVYRAAGLLVILGYLFMIASVPMFFSSLFKLSRYASAQLAVEQELKEMHFAVFLRECGLPEHLASDLADDGSLSDANRAKLGEQLALQVLEQEVEFRKLHASLQKRMPQLLQTSLLITLSIFIFSLLFFFGGSYLRRSKDLPYCRSCSPACEKCSTKMLPDQVSKYSSCLTSFGHLISVPCFVGLLVLTVVIAGSLIQERPAGVSDEKVYALWAFIAQFTVAEIVALAIGVWLTQKQEVWLCPNCSHYLERAEATT